MPTCGEHPRDGILGTRPRVVIAQAAEDAEGRAQAGQRLHHGLLRGRVPSDEVAGQRDQVRLQFVGDAHVLADLVLGHERADVNIGKLRDAETGEGLRAGCARRMRCRVVSRFSRP